MTDLTDRMRTCAAAIAAGMNKNFQSGEPSPLYNDAADLLLEASNALEAIPEPLGDPMEILPTLPEQYRAETEDIKRLMGTWTAGDLPAVPTGQPSPRPNRVCPKCDSRAVKRVFRHESKAMLACPVCAASWEYKP